MNNSDEAVKDLAMWLEDMVLKRRLTHEEMRDLTIKVRYIWKEATEREQTRSMDSFRSGRVR